MVEMIALFLYLRHVGALARERGRNPNLYQLMLVVFWVTAEVGAFALGHLFFNINYGEIVPHKTLIIYLVALFAAGIAATIVDLLVKRPTGQGHRHKTFNGARLPARG